MKVFSTACRGVMIRNSIYDLFSAYKTNAHGFFDQEALQILALVKFTTEFFETIPRRLDAEYSFATPLVRLNYASVMRFCRGLALVDGVYTSSPSMCARLWVHELLREFMDKLPYHQRLRDKLARQMSTQVARVPMEDVKLAALQVALLDEKSPILWAHVPMLLGAHVRAATYGPAQTLPFLDTGRLDLLSDTLHQETSSSSYEIMLSYQEVNSAAEDGEDEEKVLQRREDGSMGGETTSVRRTSFLYRRRSDQRLVLAKKEEAYSLPGKRKRAYESSSSSRERVSWWL